MAVAKQKRWLVQEVTNAMTKDGLKLFKKKKKDKEATWEALCVNYKANSIY